MIDMKHERQGGHKCPQQDPDSLREHRQGHHKHHHGRHGRPFDYGELRLLVLAMTAEQPRHGYELIRVIEERMGGSYSPSPGVIYPTLSWLEDMGYASVEEGGGRKRYSLTSEGKAFLTANRVAADELLSRGSLVDNTLRRGEPAPVTRAMENLKMALRLRLRSGPLDQTTAEKIGGALDAAAIAVERA